MTRSKHIIRTVSLDTEVAVWLQQEAAAQNRTTSNLVATLLMRIRDETEDGKTQDRRPEGRLEAAGLDARGSGGRGVAVGATAALKEPAGAKVARPSV